VSTPPIPPAGRIRDTPEDFVVEEVPAYAPSGEGEHVFVRLTKTNRTTLEVVRDLARACGCDPRAAGFAGMKDKRAVATQTVSLQAPRGTSPRDVADRARSVAIDGVVVHEATPHGNKMKPGHLAGNRFAIAVRGIDEARLPEVTAAFDRIAAEGVANAFGAQRYGRGGDNVARALAWLRGEERGPRDPRVQRLLWSAVQSAVFDAVLRERVREGTWATALAGDLLKLRSSGGLFLCADVQTDAERAARGELSPTGPILGARMRWPEGAPAEIEQRSSEAIVGEGFDLARVRRLGEGSRRALRLWVEGLRYDIESDPGGHGPHGVRVYFVLPKGAYATTVLANAVNLTETHTEGHTTDDVTSRARESTAPGNEEEEQEEDDP
jgi:tRNA pseudouridine13 synthase